MDNSNPPVKFPIAFAQNATAGYITAVPATTSTPGAASFNLGWGPETFLSPASGGTAPLGDYFNGLENQVTSNLRWIQAGGVFQYDSAFQSAIGGYRQGAILANAAGTGFWISTVNNNMTDPDTGGSGWTVLQPGSYPFSSITGVPSFVLNSQFTGSNQNLSVNGYQEFPGGLLMQWSDTPFTGVSDQVSTITYPIAFPSTPGIVWTPQVTVYDASGATSGSPSNFIAATVVSFSLSSCQVAFGQNGGGGRNITAHLEVKGRWQ